MSSQLAIAVLPRAHFVSTSEPARSRPASALQYFDASSFDEARPSARAFYANAAHCPRCRNVLSQRFARLGSTLFCDEDPRVLARAFDAADRDGCTVRLLAACIVLFGRERVGVH